MKMFSALTVIRLFLLSLACFIIKKKLKKKSGESAWFLFFFFFLPSCYCFLRRLSVASTLNHLRLVVGDLTNRFYYDYYFSKRSLCRLSGRFYLLHFRSDRTVAHMRACGERSRGQSTTTHTQYFIASLNQMHRAHKCD